MQASESPEGNSGNGSLSAAISQFGLLTLNTRTKEPSRSQSLKKVAGFSASTVLDAISGTVNRVAATFTANQL